MALWAACLCLLWFELADALSKSRCILALRAGPGTAQGEREREGHISFLMRNSSEVGEGMRIIEE